MLRDMVLSISIELNKHMVKRMPKKLLDKNAHHVDCAGEG
jgi:hypothetical protein